MTPVHRICFDTSEGDELGRYSLDIPQALKDIAPVADKLAVGMHVVIYMTGEVEVEAVLDFDKEQLRWVASPIWSTLRPLDRI